MSISFPFKNGPKSYTWRASTQNSHLFVIVSLVIWRAYQNPQCLIFFITVKITQEWIIRCWHRRWERLVQYVWWAIFLMIIELKESSFQVMNCFHNGDIFSNAWHKYYNLLCADYLLKYMQAYWNYEYFMCFL